MQNMHLLLVPQSQLQNVTVTKMTWFLVGSSGLEQWPLPPGTPPPPTPPHPDKEISM